jgi:sodium/bile acid cotransporter 7
MIRLRTLGDNISLLLLVVVGLATLWPCRGAVAEGFGSATTLAVALLFFMHGAKLSRDAVVAGLTHWRLHLLVLGTTFVMFPLLGLALRPVFVPLLSPGLYSGVLFLCALPATMQSAIAFTALARGNVPAAVCSASASSLIGIFLSPLIVQLLLARHSGSASALDAVRGVALQLFVPFVGGQVARGWIAGWVARHANLLGWIDRSSILLVVYTAFSEAATHGLWHQVALPMLTHLVLACLVLLGAALLLTTFLARRLGFDKEDEITIVFCGSKKSLAAGVPMARVLFDAHSAGAVMLPLMLFHQIQLMVCALLAQRYAARAAAPDTALASDTLAAESEHST